MGVPGLEPEMPKPQIYSLLRFQFRSHTHENRRVLKTLLNSSVFPEWQTAQQLFANLPLNTYYGGCQPIIVLVITIFCRKLFIIQSLCYYIAKESSTWKQYLKY